MTGIWLIRQNRDDIDNGKVFQSPDMTAWAVFFKVQRDHEKDPLMW